MYKLQREITPQFAGENICQIPWKEMPRNSGIKTGRWSVRFLSGSQHYRPNLHSKANLREILGCFVDLEKAYDRVARDKLRKILREHGVKLWLHQCNYEILTHGINFFGDNLFLFKLTLVEAKFFTEQILPEYLCSTSENLKSSPQNSVLISEKFALVETTYVFLINTEGAVGVIV